MAMIHTKVSFISMLFFTKILCFVLLVYSIFASLQADFEINMVFPHAYTSQGIKVYQAGEIIPTDVSGSSISFFVKELSRAKELHLLVVKPSDLSYVLYEQAKNTIQHRVVQTDKPYKFYQISFLSTEQRYQVRQKELDESGKIPDQTVIVFYNPEYITDFSSSKEQPVLTFTISENIFALSGGKSELCYEEIRYLFETLNFDPMHQKISYKITLANNCCKQIIGL